MDAVDLAFSPNHRAVIDRFIAACQADDRVVAAFLGGSFARGGADPYSDLDLYLLTTDEGFDDFFAHRYDFLRLLGEPLLAEDLNMPNTIFFIMASGVEGELAIESESRLIGMFSGAYKVLLDEKGVLDGLVFSKSEPAIEEQREKLRRLIFWFWHDLSHFITALGRGHLWWAQGQLEALRECGVALARWRRKSPDSKGEPYYKVDRFIPLQDLAPLRDSFASLDAGEMLDAALVVLRFYKDLAVPLARDYGIDYPEELERVVVERLEKLRGSGL